MFKALSESPWLVTALPCAVSVVVLGAASRARGFRRAYLIVFALEIAADAWLTGPWSPMAATSTSLAQAVGVLFVILGDLRYFVLLERYREPRRAGVHVAVRAVGWSLLVPLASQLAMRAAPALFEEPRAVYLVYELLFVALLTALRALVAPSRDANAWIARLATFELVQYVLWATADVVLLARSDDSDVGFAIRIIPNLMYYALFLVLVTVTLPRAPHAPRSSRA